MKIRQKRLILLLATALVPAVAISVSFRRSMLVTGDHVAGRTRQMLEDNAKLYLQTLVDGFSSIVSRDKTAIELALTRQAREVELRLAAEPPDRPVVFWSEDYDKPVNAPKDVELTDKYTKTIEASKPVPVSFSQQVFFLVRGADKAAVSADVARLSTMPEVYSQLRRSNPELITWLYTALEAGLHSSYPGHGGYPPEYDPRVREWYTEAKQAGGLAWSIFPDVSTRQVTVTASMPVRSPDGRFAGVTAIDIRAAGMLEAGQLPAQWHPSTTVMQVQPGLDDAGRVRQLTILAQESYLSQSGDWHKAVKLEALESADVEQFEAIKNDVAAGVSGVRRMEYRGKDCFWAYSAWREGAPLSVMIVPYETIVAQAASMEQFILGRITHGLEAAAAIILVILVAAVVVAIISARSVTEPIYTLAGAADELSKGNYTARADIRTGDELEELAEVFNDIGPKLAEREKMKHALELAREIQQHLLPAGCPSVPGFDIAGLNIPCDETGGDYYDFIELAEFGPGKIGIALGDVTGHGIGAALLMASARSALRSQVANHVDALDALFDKVNASLVRDTGEDRFMTLFYGVLDAGSRSLRWASGGHDPAIWLRRAGGRIEELTNPPGIPLGVLEGVPFGQAGPIELTPGDILLVGTDGIWEAPDGSGRQFGKERLREIISQQVDSTAEQICQAVVQAVNEFRAGHPQQDDITLVVVKAIG